MSSLRPLSEFSIVQDLGESVFERVKTRVIRTLESMEGGLSGDDSGLATFWQELCVQLQHEQSIFWNTYDSTVHEVVQHEVEELQVFEREALWLLTHEGSDWECEEEGERVTHPVCVSDIVRHVVENGIYEDARFSTNPNVLSYLRGKWGFDERRAGEGSCENDA